MIRTQTHSLALALRLAPALALLAFSATTHGALIRYDFGGTIKVADASTGVSVGDRFTGSLVYDDEAPGASDVLNSTGKPTNDYFFSGTHRPLDPTPDGTGLQFRVGDRTFAPVSTGVTATYTVLGTSDGPGSASMTLNGHLASPDSPGVWMNLIGRAGHGTDTFVNGRLPVGLKLSDLTSATIAVEAIAGGAWPQDGRSPLLLGGTIDTLTATHVPEPVWTVAALMGAAFWAVRRRKTA